MNIIDLLRLYSVFSSIEESIDVKSLRYEINDNNMLVRIYNNDKLIIELRVYDDKIYKLIKDYVS